MTHPFKVGDHVHWNVEAGQTTGRIIKVHVQDIDFKGRMHRCSKDDPQYEIQSDISGLTAMHKGAALRKK